MPTRAPDQNGHGRGVRPRPWPIRPWRASALLAARRAPRTVDAYRRDLADLDRLPRPLTDDGRRRRASRPGSPTCAPAAARRRARSPGAPPRRAPSSAILVLGLRPDNPAAEVDLPRRRQRLRRARSRSGEVERLIEAANGTTPRSLRDRALIELLYGGGLRVSEAVGLERGGVDLDARLVRCIGKGDKERVVPLGTEAVEALRRYLSRGRPYLDRRHRPELFLNAQGGPLTRAGAFLIISKLAAQGRARPRARAPASPPPLLRHAPARGRRRPAERAGDARPRRSGNHRDLHPCFGSATAGDLLPGTPARASNPTVTWRQSTGEFLSSPRPRRRSPEHCSSGWPSATACWSTATRAVARPAGCFGTAASAAATARRPPRRPR